MAIVFFLILRTSLHVRGPNSHLNNKPAPCFLTYETPIYLHLAVPECSGRVTMLAEVQIRASAFGTRLPFLVLLWCGSRTRTKAWVNFPRRSTFIFPFFHSSLLPHRRIEEKVCDTRQKNCVWQKEDQDGRWEKTELRKWEKKWNGESRSCVGKG